MWLQLRPSRFRAPYSRTAVAAVAVFGAMVADGIHAGVGVPYAVSTIAFAAITGTVFAPGRGPRPHHRGAPFGAHHPPAPAREAQ